LGKAYTYLRCERMHSDSFVSGRRPLGESPTFSFDHEWRGPLRTRSPTLAPSSFAPTPAPETPTPMSSANTPTFVQSPSSSDPPLASSNDRGSPNQLYGGAECWVWILVAAILGVVVGYLLALVCTYWNRTKTRPTEEKGITSGGLLRDPLRELPAHISDTMVSNVEMGQSITTQPAVFFPGQSLRSETRGEYSAFQHQPGEYPAFQHQPSESVMITGPITGTLRDDVEEKKQQQLEREKVHHELGRGMTLEGTSYQYFHPDEQTDPRQAGGGDDDDNSPRISFTFSTQ